MKDRLEDLKKYSGYQWFMFPKDFLNFLDLGDAVFLANLYNVAYLAYRKKEDDWFPTRTERLAKDLRLSRQAAWRRVRALEELGLISTDIRGGFAREKWIKIHYDLVDECARLGRVPKRKIRCRVSPGNTSVTRRTPGNARKTNRLSSVTRHITYNKKEQSPLSEWATECASSLREAVAKAQNISKRSNIKAWVAPIEKTHRLDGFPIETIQKVCSWYCKILPDEREKIKTGEGSFIPHVMSGSAFRKKFPNLEISYLKSQPRKGRERWRITYLDKKGNEVRMFTSIKDLTPSNAAHVLKREAYNEA